MQQCSLQGTGPNRGLTGPEMELTNPQGKHVPIERFIETWPRNHIHLYLISRTSGSDQENMPVLTRCRGKTPEGEAMKASPNPKKLKQAARKLKEAKKNAEQKEKAGKAKDGEAVEPTLMTPSPKPILKKALHRLYVRSGIV